MNGQFNWRASTICLPFTRIRFVREQVVSRHTTMTQSTCIAAEPDTLTEFPAEQNRQIFRESRSPIGRRDRVHRRHRDGRGEAVRRLITLGLAAAPERAAHASDATPPGPRPPRPPANPDEAAFSTRSRAPGLNARTWHG